MQKDIKGQGKFDVNDGMLSLNDLLPKDFGKQKLETEQYDFNLLAMFFGDDYKVNDQITIHQPRIGDFIDYGEANIYGAVMPWISNSTTYRVILWDAGIDWTKLSDFEFFAMFIKMVDIQYSKLIFGDIDWAKFEPIAKPDEVDEKGNPVMYLYNADSDIMIDEALYKKMAVYIRAMFHINPKTEIVKGKSAKKDVIATEKADQEKKEENKQKSMLLPMISFCLNHAGFKYNSEQLRNVGIVEFMDSVQRLQIYESTSALMKGMYSGFVDTKKINKKEFDFMRDIEITS